VGKTGITWLDGFCLFYRSAIYLYVFQELLGGGRRSILY